MQLTCGARVAANVLFLALHTDLRFEGLVQVSFVPAAHITADALEAGAVVLAPHKPKALGSGKTISLSLGHDRM